LSRADLGSAVARALVALLVMATHGRTGWRRLRLGSVTTATVHAAGVPVLMVPAGDPERAVRPAPASVTREPVSC